MSCTCRASVRHINKLVLILNNVLGAKINLKLLIIEVNVNFVEQNFKMPSVSVQMLLKKLLFFFAIKHWKPSGQVQDLPLRGVHFCTNETGFEAENNKQRMMFYTNRQSEPVKNLRHPGKV